MRRPVAIPLPAWARNRELRLTSKPPFQRQPLLDAALQGISDALGVNFDDVIRYAGPFIVASMNARSPEKAAYISGLRKHLSKSIDQYERVDGVALATEEQLAEVNRTLRMLDAQGEVDFAKMVAGAVVTPPPTEPYDSALFDASGRLQSEALARVEAARETAMNLLRSHLSDEQRVELLQTHTFRVVGPSGRIYKIGPWGCEAVAPDGRVLESLCVHWETWADAMVAPIGEADMPPPGDMMLLCKLFIESDEEAFRAQANVSVTDRDQLQAMSGAADYLKTMHSRADRFAAVRAIGTGLGDLIQNGIDRNRWGEAGFDAIREARERRKTCQK